MKAVNLIPPEERRGPTSVSRAGNAAYVLLGALAVAVLAIAAVVLTDNTVKHRRGDLAEARIKATAASAEATTLKPYADFAGMKQKRVQTLTSLAQSRFDWERVMRELSEAMPKSAWLSSMTGTVAPGVNLEGATTSSLRGARQSPAVELVGCARSQAEVARMMTRMRLIRGVTGVSLDSSAKSDVNTASGGVAQGDSNSSAGGCGGGDKHPLFQVVLFFEKTTVAAPSGAGGAAPATPAPGTTTTPSQNGQAAASGSAQTSTTPAGTP